MGHARRVVAAAVILLVCLHGWNAERPRVAAAEASVSLKTEEARSAPASDECWIFTHLQKCGGTTIKEMMSESWGHRHYVYDSGQWKLGKRNLEPFGQKVASGQQWNVLSGGYPEALRRSSAVAEKCQWFTMFRHPIARMVSAYFYCSWLPGDVACASEVVKAKNVDLVTFAKHWGNFGLRQFALSLVSADDVMAYSRTAAARQKLPHVDDLSTLSGWYLLKMYLEDQPGSSVYGTMPDGALYDMLQPVQDLLRDSYSAVGILEEFNTTLSLFDAALAMPGVKWHQLFDKGGRGNVNVPFGARAAEVLEKAWTNSEIKRYMALDILLYEHAVDVFHEQARSYGLE